MSITIKQDARIHALVLMPNHFHLLISTPGPDLGMIMNTFMQNLTVDCHAHSGRSGRLFGGPYHWCLIDSNDYYAQALKYIYRNPVRAGLSKSVEKYPFSTFPGLIGEGPLEVPIHSTQIEMESHLPGLDPLDWLSWLNRPFAREWEESIRLALRKKSFRFSRDQLAQLARLKC